MPPSTLMMSRRSARPMRGVGPTAVAEDVVGGVHAEGSPDRAVDHHEGRAAPGAGRHAVQAELRLAHGLHARHHHRQVLGQTAGHHRRDGDLLGGDPPAPYRLDADGGVGTQARPSPESAPRSCRWAARSATRPSSRCAGTARSPRTRRRPRRADCSASPSSRLAGLGHHARVSSLTRGQSPTGARSIIRSVRKRRQTCSIS